jgi:methylenetetrahydrofolate dehydrogenase (NADP+) / methenyltetrahydrofolate cyclohydrolase
MAKLPPLASRHRSSDVQAGMSDRLSKARRGRVGRCGQYRPRIAGLEAVVVGRSNVVGKPLLQLLLAENATVTIAHSKTRNPAAVCRRADVVFAATGQPETVRKDWIKPGATVIDIGINRTIGADGKPGLVGDVAFAEVAEVAGAITPVPGGVGPMTIACLLENTLAAAKKMSVRDQMLKR